MNLKNMSFAFPLICLMTNVHAAQKSENKARRRSSSLSDVELHQKLRDVNPELAQEYLTQQITYNNALNDAQNVPNESQNNSPVHTHNIMGESFIDVTSNNKSNNTTALLEQETKLQADSLNSSNNNQQQLVDTSNTANSSNSFDQALDDLASNINNSTHGAASDSWGNQIQLQTTQEQLFYEYLRDKLFADATKLAITETGEQYQLRLLHFTRAVGGLVKDYEVALNFVGNPTWLDRKYTDKVNKGRIKARQDLSLNIQHLKEKFNNINSTACNCVYRTLTNDETKGKTIEKIITQALAIFGTPKPSLAERVKTYLNSFKTPAKTAIVVAVSTILIFSGRQVVKRLLKHA